jgi:hypothetical protein
VNVTRFRCPDWACYRAVPVAVHSSTPDRIAADIAAAACEHITTAQLADLAAGTVPQELTVRGQR